MRFFSKAAVFGCAVAMALTACGGASPESLIEAAGQAAGADVDDLELNLDGDGDGLSATIGGAEVNFGDGTGSSARPDWLEPEFVWPDGFDANYSVNDPSTGERAYVGLVDGADAAALAAEQDALLISAGYERLGDSTIYVREGRPAVDVNIEDFEGRGAAIDVRHRNEDEQTLRDTFAPIEGSGTMTVSLGGDDYVFEGPCWLVSDGGQFSTAEPLNGTTSQDGSISVDVREGERDYILASVGIASETVFESWSIVQEDEAGNPPTIVVDEAGFIVDGFMIDFTTSEVVPVAIAVACPGS